MKFLGRVQMGYCDLVHFIFNKSLHVQHAKAYLCDNSLLFTDFCPSILYKRFFWNLAKLISVERLYKQIKVQMFAKSFFAVSSCCFEHLSIPFLWIPVNIRTDQKILFKYGRIVYYSSIQIYWFSVQFQFSSPIMLL